MPLILAFLLLCLGFFPSFAAEPQNLYQDQLIQTARRKNLADKRYWHLLLHYRPRLLGGVKSQADGKNFFLSPRGKTHPEEELEATVKAFFDPPAPDSDTMHPQCRFPARYSWLKEELSFDPQHLLEQPCPRFEAWQADWNPESITIIFASYYLNNPASMYGHTFLRINRKDLSESERLMDYSINFAADTPTRNGIVFAAKGLLGAYPGRFSTHPYYFKVQQYNNIERRDLWEYTLNLTPEQIQQMTKHLWELGDTYFDYYFLTENCSYQLLPLLETANPVLHLSDSFHFKAIPTDTMRAVLRSPGLVKSSRLRPSALGLILGRRALLTNHELRLAEALAKNQKAPQELESLPEKRQALILDSAYDYLRYRHGFKRYQSLEADEQERELLLHRQKLKISSRDLPAPVLGEAMAPESGHKTGRIGASFVSLRHSSAEELSLRPAVHDLAASPQGYVPGSQLEMFHLILRFHNDSHKTSLEKFSLINIVSLSPWDRWFKHPSWKIGTGWEKAKDLDLSPDNGLYYGVDGGLGLAWETRLLRRQTWYALAEADTGVGGIFRDSYRMGIGGTVGLLWEITRFWRLHAEESFLRYPLGDIRSTTKTNLTSVFSLAKDWEFRASFRRVGPSQEGLFTWNLYL